VLGQLRDAVDDVVRRQVDAGIDIVDDGEFGKTMWSQYVNDRQTGWESATGRDGRANPKGP
jgi:5-methyltetrahydropteroyltriglutamate--homocysteine methyltransferase